MILRLTWLITLTKFTFGVIHLVRTQNFPKNQEFLPPDMHMYVCVPGATKCQFFGKFYVRTKWMTPLKENLKESLSRRNTINDRHKVQYVSISESNI